jgi:pyruvate/2-oxoglutarate dehydrogenase complex dihydrolipoamide dehydrogenase (E3) component
MWPPSEPRSWGLKTAVVEKQKLGGTCLIKAASRRKALLRSAEVYRTAKKADEFGVVIPEVGPCGFLKFKAENKK